MTLMLHKAFPGTLRDFLPTTIYIYIHVGFSVGAKWCKAYEKVISDLGLGGGFHWVLRFSPPPLVFGRVFRRVLRFPLLLTTG